MRVLKTWTNSWATSLRMHEPHKLCCLFGCEHADDSQVHYVQCPVIFAMLIKLRSAQLVSSDPLTRLGWGIPIRILACVFSAYHSAKRHVGTYAENIGVFCEAFFLVAIELGLVCASPVTMDFSSFSIHSLIRVSEHRISIAGLA